MNEIMWKGKSYSGMTVENGIIINDGDEVVHGDINTIGIQKMGGYRDFLGDQGKRLICQGNLTLMGQIPVEERICLIENGWQYKDGSVDWTDCSFVENNLYNIINTTYVNNIIFTNTYEEGKVTGIHADSQSEVYHSGYGIYGRYTGLDVNFTNEEGYLINFIKPTDLYTKVYMNPIPTYNPASGVPFEDRNGRRASFKIKITSADLNNYYCTIVYEIYSYDSQQTFRSGTYSIPRNSNVIGLFLYCTEWAEDGYKTGLGIASFKTIDENNYILTAFYPLGSFFINIDTCYYYDTIKSLAWSITKNCYSRWQSYYKISKDKYIGENYYNPNDGIMYEDQAMTIAIDNPAQNAISYDKISNNYYLYYEGWSIVNITQVDDNYLYSPIMYGAQGHWSSVTPSPEYEYAAQISKRYNYIDRATYNSLIQEDQNG